MAISGLIPFLPKGTKTHIIHSFHFYKFNTEGEEHRKAVNPAHPIFPRPTF